MKKMIGLIVFGAMAGAAFAGDNFGLNGITGKNMPEAAKAEIISPQLQAKTAARSPLRRPEAKPEATAVVITEKGLPARTIFFEADVLDSKGILEDMSGGGKDSHGGHGSYARMSCVARDTGWEEHWGGHGGGPSELDACGECLRKHDSCRYNCSVEQYRCTARFNPSQAPVPPDQIQPPLPAPSYYEGDLRPDQGSAEDSALLRCMQYTQGRQGYCSSYTCDTESRVVKSGSCRK